MKTCFWMTRCNGGRAYARPWRSFKREHNFKVGQLYNVEDAKTALRDIFLLQLFDNVQVVPRPDDRDQSKVQVDIMFADGGERAEANWSGPSRPARGASPIWCPSSPAARCSSSTATSMAGGDSCTARCPPRTSCSRRMTWGSSWSTTTRTASATATRTRPTSRRACSTRASSRRCSRADRRWRRFPRCGWTALAPKPPSRRTSRGNPKPPRASCLKKSR